MFKNREGKVRSGWKIAGMMVTSYLLTIIIGIIIGIAVGIYYLLQMKGSKIDMTQFQNEIRSITEGNNTFKYVSLLIQEITFILIPVVAWKYIIKRPLSNMGLTSFKKGTKELIIGLFFGIVSISMVFILLVLTSSAKVTAWAPHFTWDQLVYVLIYISVGFAEEIFTRGYIMSALRQTRNVYVAVLGSAIIFALMHSGNSGISLIAYLNLTLVGILFAFMYLKSGNLWMCIGFHITWNYFQGCVYGFEVSGNTSNGIITTQNTGNALLNGGAFGPEGGLFVTIILLFGFLFVSYYYKNSTFDFIASEPDGIDKSQLHRNVTM